MFGDTLLASQAKGVLRKRSVERPVAHVDLSNLLGGKRGWAVCFSAQFYSNADTVELINRL
jgi:hypothetical protein